MSHQNDGRDEDRHGVSSTLPAGSVPEGENTSERPPKLASPPPGAQPDIVAPVVLLRPLVVGDVVGPYRILGHLGSGGMGHIYRALDLRLEREVAIKVASEPIASDDDAMLREARALAALNHPNVVMVYEVGVHESRGFIVMELLRGETLRARMSRESLPLASALSLVCDLLRGLSAAHNARVVHLDIKPENVFITADGTVKLLDFGVARLKRTGAHDERAIAGTIAYMAPEQLLGENLDFRADLFAVGTVLHELTTGKHPFQRPHFAATMYALMQGEFFKDSTFPDPEIEAIIRACMQRDPSARPGSAGHVLEKLERVLRARTQVVRSEVAYAETEHGNVAFQSVGAARGADLVVIPGLLSRFDMWTHEPEGYTFLRALAEAGRVVLLDRCGFGASDRISDASLPQLDEEIDHIDAVLDAVGSSRVVLLALGEGAPLAAFYAAVRPARVGGLVVYGGAARYSDAASQARLTARADHWGTEANASLCAPNFAGDPRLRKWLSTWEKMTASPRTARSWASQIARTDVTAALPFLRCPTLVLHRQQDGWCSAEASRPFEELIPGARRVVLPGEDHVPCAGAADLAPQIVRFARASMAAPAANAEAGSLETWAFTDAPPALLPPRLRAEITAVQGPARLVRVDRPGVAVRALRNTIMRMSPAGRVVLACAPRGGDVASVLSEVEPLFAQARPGVIAATPLARTLLEGTAGLSLQADTKPAPERARAAASSETIEDVAPLQHKSFSVHAEPGARLRIEGSIMLKDPERQLVPHFHRIHECAVGCGTLVVDVRRLSQINSSALGMFIRWVGWIQAEPEANRYKLSIVADPSVLWQRANLMPLAMIAPDVIDVVTAGPK